MLKLHESTDFVEREAETDRNSFRSLPFRPFIKLPLDLQAEGSSGPAIRGGLGSIGILFGRLGVDLCSTKEAALKLQIKLLRASDSKAHLCLTKYI